jgi:hypothetical protein
VLRTGLCVGVFGIVLLGLDIHLSGGAADFVRLAPVFLLLGVANGLMLPAVVGASLADVAPSKAGAAAGALITSQQFAAAAGIAILSEIYFTTLGARPGLHAYIHAIEYVLVLDAALLAIGAAASFMLPAVRR